MNNLEMLYEDLEILHQMYRKHPESAEVIAEQIYRVEELIEMCQDGHKIDEILQEAS